MGVNGKGVEHGCNLHGWGDHTSFRRPRNRWEDNMKMDFKVVRRGCGLDSSGLGCRPMTGSCEYNNEFLGSIKGKECFDSLSDYQLLKKVMETICHPFLLIHHTFIQKHERKKKNIWET
jgi:hypothetical protein